MAEPIYRRNVDLMEAELGDELVTLDVEAGKCFGFNEVATAVWRLLETPQPVSAITGSLLEQFDVDPGRCSEDLSDLLEDMTAKGLIIAGQ